MDSTPDQKFFDNFSAVLAALLVFTVVCLVLANSIAGNAAGVSETPAYQQQLIERVRPVGDVVISGQEKTLYGRDAVASVAIASAAPAVETVTMASFNSGEEVYNSACVACHGLGVAGAPKMGDAANWAPRIAQGMETLYTHAIEGYSGNAGVMPAKGGRADITDDHVRQSVDYMVSQSQ
ncbi:MAG: cytochrome c5 family protein [Gammaproteobacteria bacterium]